RQAHRLGLADRGALTTLAVDALDDPAAARAALAAHVPPDTASVYLQPDLSAVAPGPLRAAVDARLRRIARLERAGIASQWRITAQSVAGALAGGESAESVLEFLAGISLTGVPQPVAYLVRDAAARFGSLRVRPVDPAAEGGARSQARSDDAQLIRTIAVDRALAALGSAQSGPHRVTFRLDAEDVLDALLAERYPAVLEDDAGALVLRRT
ncbi:helicase-associated domain-containing protein, partial [Agrococcus sp. HG114]|uniref:helicase-associated domain-containing protein n=1 Tax=Agrococcus sp. HG114 TaxID=2969757 RepID=UPI00215A4219